MQTSEHKQVAMGAQETIEDAFANFDGDCDELISTLEEAKSELESHIDDTLEDRISNLESAFPNGCPALETLTEYKDDFETFRDSIDSAVSEIESARDNVDTTLLATLDDEGGSSKRVIPREFKLELENIDDDITLKLLKDKAECAVTTFDSLTLAERAVLLDEFKEAQQARLQELRDEVQGAESTIECNI
jgi:hypothetical protein